MAEPIPFASPEEEIKYLEAKILEKKQALEGRTSREIVSEVLKEHTANTSPPSPPPSNAVQSSTSTDTDDLDKNVAVLVQSAFQEGIVKAVDRARGTHNPYLFDALHDALVDRFLTELKARGVLHE